MPAPAGIRKADQPDRHDAILHAVVSAGDSNRLRQERCHPIR